MPWGVIACAVVSAYGSRQPYKAPEPDLEQLAREHRAKMEAINTKTLRDAQIGTLLLLALAGTLIYGAAQLAGLV